MEKDTYVEIGIKNGKIAEVGIIEKEELKTYGEDFSWLMNHISHKVDGVEFSAGALGHGLSFGVGKALSAKIQKLSFRTFVILSDGEMDEGSTWEALMFAAHHKLDNLIVVVDRNELCIMGKTEELLELGDLRDKWCSFGWYGVDVDGHSFDELIPAFDLVGKTGGKPLVIIANTVKGKGISYMEGRSEWHNRMPSDKQIAQARTELGIEV